MQQRLSVRIAGPGVLEGKIALRDLQRVVRPLEQAVRALLPASKPAASEGGGPRKPAVRFLLSGIRSGSAVAELEMDTELDPMLGDLSWDPLDQLVQGAAGNGAQLPKLASDHLDRMARSLPDGVDFVELGLHDSGTSARIYRRAPADVAVGTDELLTISGRLVSVDFRAGVARIEVPAILKRNVGTQLLVLRFPDELASDMQRCARQHVAAHGVATKTAAGIVESLAVRWIQAVIDDRPGLWAPKRFTWPSADERLDNVDMDEFVRTSRDDGEDDV